MCHAISAVYGFQCVQSVSNDVSCLLCVRFVFYVFCFCFLFCTIADACFQVVPALQCLMCLFVFCFWLVSVFVLVCCVMLCSMVCQMCCVSCCCLVLLNMFCFIRFLIVLFLLFLGSGGLVWCVLGVVLGVCVVTDSSFRGSSSISQPLLTPFRGRH